MVDIKRIICRPDIQDRYTRLIYKVDGNSGFIYRVFIQSLYTGFIYNIYIQGSYSGFICRVYLQGLYTGIINRVLFA